MAASIDPFTMSNLDQIRSLQAENASLKAEIGVLREELDALRSDLLSEIAADRRRLRQLEGAKVLNSRLVLRHIDELIAWLRDHSDRKGITYEEAAKLLNVTTERISQLKPSIEADGRLQIAKTRGRYRKKYIELA